jgi:ComF family protein
VAIPRTGFESVRDNFVEKLFWGRCRLEKAASFAWYVKGGRMSRLIYRFKYDGIRQIGFELGRIFGVALRESGFVDDIDCLVPVPLHKSKERKRGFNQSLIIANGISSVTGIAVKASGLVRSSGTGTQTVRSRIERWRNVEGIFSVKDADSLKGMHLLIVDDVITTGSTIDACATVLLQVEGVRVSAVSLAVAMV